MIDLVKNNVERITELCKDHRVKALYVFGSAARQSDFTATSDVDFLVQFNYPKHLSEKDVFEKVENKTSLAEKLTKLVNRKVDLIDEDFIKNKYLKYFINKERKLIYGLS